jgi:hypothetical protein
MNLPVGSMEIQLGYVPPVGHGEPDVVVSAPVEASILRIEISLVA